MDPVLARELWRRLETVNAVTYFSPECLEAPTRLGLKGFWMGYFASRAAPMGAVGPAVIDATFFNFHPERVRRAIPDAWSLVDPGVLIAARAQAAATALRRLLTDEGARSLADHLLPVAHEAIARAASEGRPLFAANREVEPPPDPVAATWQAATTLREHRNDGHVALLTAAGLDGCEVHVLFAAGQGLPPQMYQQSRGWSEQDWSEATDRLAARGLLSGDGALTEAGRGLRDGIELRTDELAVVPYEAMGSAAVTELIGKIDPVIERIATAGEISFPNPMGLPRR